MYQQFPPEASRLALPLLGDKGQRQSLLIPTQRLVRRAKGCQNQRKAPFSFEIAKCSKIGTATAGECWALLVELVLWAILFQLDSSITFRLEIQTIRLGSGLLLSYSKIRSGRPNPSPPARSSSCPEGKHGVPVTWSPSRGQWRVLLSMAVDDRVQPLGQVRQEGHRWVPRSWGRSKENATEKGQGCWGGGAGNRRKGKGSY